MNSLRTLDTNLLVVLDVLLDEVHVTRAAMRLALSQPATSSALERLRAVFDDPLLERIGGRMRLTPKAQALREPLREVVRSMERLVGVAPTALREVKQTVHLVMADVMAAAVAGPLAHDVQQAAPGVQLVFHPWSGGEAALARAERGSVDIAFSVLPRVDPAQFHAEHLLSEHYRVAVRAGHPAARRFDLDAWLAWPHVITGTDGNARTPLDALLAAQGRSRRVGLVLSSFTLVPEVLRHTDLIGLVPSLCLNGDAGRGLMTFDPPVAVDGFRLTLAWHRRHEDDVAVQWVAAELKRVAGERLGPNVPF